MQKVDSITSMVLSLHVPFPHKMLFSSQNDGLGDGVGGKEGMGDSNIDVIDGNVINDVGTGVNVSENTNSVVGKISTIIELLKSIDSRGLDVNNGVLTIRVSVRIGEMVEKTLVDSGRTTMVSVGATIIVSDVSAGVSGTEREGDGVKMLSEAVISEVAIGISSDESATVDVGRREPGDIVKDATFVV